MITNTWLKKRSVLMVGLEKFSMQLWIYRKKSWRWFENSVLYIHTMLIYREALPCIYTIAVTLAVRSHLFSFRTQKLSSLAPKILNWSRFGKIGCCCIQTKRTNWQKRLVLFLCLQQLNFPDRPLRYRRKMSQFFSYSSCRQLFS